MIPSIVTHIEYSPSKEVTFVRCKPSRTFSFKEGQFMMVRSDHIHTGIGRPLKKAYSIATTNHELQTDGTIGYIVKKVREGFMSEHLTEKISVGDLIHLTGPAGHMIDTGAHDKYLLVSVGSGLSPMIGLYEAIAAKQQPDTKIAMLFGERYADHVLPSTIDLFSNELVGSKKTIFLSREKKQPTPNSGKRYKDGYIQDGLDEALAFLDSKDISVFICGKPEMVDDVRARLTEYGIDTKSVKFEKY